VHQLAEELFDVIGLQFVVVSSLANAQTELESGNALHSGEKCIQDGQYIMLLKP
jgi:hypothetical protein